MKTPRENTRRTLTALSAFLLGCAFMAFGLLRGEGTVVLQKAVRVCLECIGLG